MLSPVVQRATSNLSAPCQQHAYQAPHITPVRNMSSAMSSWTVAVNDPLRASDLVACTLRVYRGTPRLPLPRALRGEPGMRK